MPFEEYYEDRRVDDELHDAFTECMNNDVVARYASDHARTLGLSKEQQLMASVVALSHALRRLQGVKVPPAGTS